MGEALTKVCKVSILANGRIMQERVMEPCFIGMKISSYKETGGMMSLLAVLHFILTINKNMLAHF